MARKRVVLTSNIPEMASPAASPITISALVPRREIGVGGCSISPRAKQLVLEVLESNRLSAGPKTAQFESEIARLHGCRFGLFCNSGTSALQIALAALKERHGWHDGDEVLVPAVTFVATSNVVLYNGLRPVFVDVEPDFYCIDPAQIERHITSRTRAIMPVHIGGLPCDMDPILDITRRHGLRMVEDSAECMFALYKGRPVGSFGDISGFSTYVAHVITTGVGGLCLTDDPENHVLLRSFANHGRDSIYIRIDDDKNLEGQALFEVASRRFSFERLGHSFRATEMEAALGLAEIEQRLEYAQRRVRNASRLCEGLRDLEDRLQLPKARPESEHAWMFFPIVVRPDAGFSAETLIERLEERGIETRRLLPLIQQPVYRRLFGDLRGQYPVADMLNRNAFYVGCHPLLETEDLDFMLETFHDFVRSRGN